MDITIIKMDIAETDLEKIIKENIKEKNINNADINKLLKETLNVLIELKEKFNLYHMDIKPCNILIKEEFI